LQAFWERHPNAEIPLRAWHKLTRQQRWRTFADVRAGLPSADRVGKLTVFNIGGNKYRLIAAIHLNRGRVYIRHVLTHAEYDRGSWKEK